MFTVCGCSLVGDCAYYYIHRSPHLAIVKQAHGVLENAWNPFLILWMILAVHIIRSTLWRVCPTDAEPNIMIDTHRVVCWQPKNENKGLWHLVLTLFSDMLIILHYFQKQEKYINNININKSNKCIVLWYNYYCLFEFLNYLFIIFWFFIFCLSFFTLYYTLKIY